MILGLGIDIIEIERIKTAVTKTPSFLNKIFSPAERRRFSAEAFQSMAGMFAAKEAVAKAIGTGFAGFMPIDVEILADEKGKPQAALHNGALELYRVMGAAAIQISISHSAEYAAAVCVIE